MKYAIWGLITLAVIIIIGVISHAGAVAWVSSIVVWGVGSGIQVSQMVKGGKDDTNLFPYVFQAIGVATMMIIQGFFA